MELRSGEDIGIDINDILDELREENKRLFNELLFANKCVNELKTHLIEIHLKYDSMIGFEDKQHFNELRDQLNGKCGENDVKREELNETNGLKDFDGILGVSEEWDNKQNNGKRNRVLKKNVNKNKVKLKTKLKTNLRTNLRTNLKTNLKTNLRTNLKTKLKTKSLKMSKRSTKTKSKSLKALKEYFDPKTKSYICPKPNCREIYENYVKFYNHFKETHRSAKFRCNFTNCKNTKGFNSKRALNTHMRIHTSTRPYLCSYEGCGYRAITNGSLGRHQIKHSNDRPFECEECHKTFKTDLTLERHSLHKHNRPEELVCPISDCRRSFVTPSQLIRHSALHESEPTLRCGYNGCQMMFFSEHPLYKHRVLVHNKAKRVKNKSSYPCDWPGCEYKGDNSQLQIHRRKHTGEKPYVCDWPQCDKRFGFKRFLTEHKNIHLNLKPEACHWPGCQYRCANKANIYKHIKQVHKK